MTWINVSDALPEDRGEPYQVIAAQKKELGGMYAGKCRRIFTQDWHIRTWPKNFVAWQHDYLGHVEINPKPVMFACGKCNEQISEYECHHCGEYNIPF